MNYEKSIILELIDATKKNGLPTTVVCSDMKCFDDSPAFYSAVKSIVRIIGVEGIPGSNKITAVSLSKDFQFEN
ncbi:hypothetical protein [Fructobacillus americanaquae]|uniref:Uncharacterized protein n=1 Tax=Fructobacillus americanaquae TaxID=2940302 RepID=A0ABY5C315_9LACO|nr:hypothetical protein [Fructobacillus americanaquae]USS91998.1 hypothetical protein M3M36_06720 [Fructobacillus americanaquae]